MTPGYKIFYIILQCFRTILFTIYEWELKTWIEFLLIVSQTSDHGQDSTVKPIGNEFLEENLSWSGSLSTHEFDIDAPVGPRYEKDLSWNHLILTEDNLLD